MKELRYDCPCVGLDGEHTLCKTHPVQESKASAEPAQATPQAVQVTDAMVQSALDSWFHLEGGLHGGSDSEERLRMRAAITSALTGEVTWAE